MNFKKQFEEMSTENLGRPFYFDPEIYLDAVEHMIVADELVFALKMLDNMPAWYRINKHPRAESIRKELLKKTWTVFDYAKDSDEKEEIDGLLVGRDIRYYPRASILKYLVQDLTSRGLKVNVHEFCPGNFSNLRHLSACGLDFGYQFYNVNMTTKDNVCELLLNHQLYPGGYNIFICFEVIEHLWDAEITLEHWASRVSADSVMVSTPYGCMGGGMDKWREREIGHVRTFTPEELMRLCAKIWPKLIWSHVGSTMQVAVGTNEPMQLKFDQLTP